MLWGGERGREYITSSNIDKTSTSTLDEALDVRVSMEPRVPMDLIISLDVARLLSCSDLTVRMELRDPTD